MSYSPRLVKSQRKCNCLRVVLMPGLRQSRLQGEEESKNVHSSQSVIKNFKNLQKRQEVAGS